MTNSLSVANLGKTFPGVVALQNVSLEVPSGRVLALVGANGAGKSTLIKILTGYYEDYAGHIAIDGQPVRLTTPHAAHSVGIRTVYQEVDTALIPSLNVTENVLIDQMKEQGQGVFINWAHLHQTAERILSSVGLTLNVHQRVQELSLHQKQLLLIARAVSQNVRYLIFDEPTTSLSLPEVERLFSVIRDLKQQQVGIIYISHRLSEVRELADQIVVLRNGQKVADFPVENFDLAHITQAMLGVPLTEVFPPKTGASIGSPVLEVRDLTRQPALKRVSLKAYRGEILGITGLVGAGKTELLRALFGADPVDAGEVLIEGQAVRFHSPTDAVQKGVYLVPEERRSQGVLVDDPVRTNLSLPFLSQFSWVSGWMRAAQELKHGREVIQRVGITPPDPDKVVRNLSGGNQQKVALGKWFGGTPRVMLFDEATQGIDVHAKQDIYRLARDLTKTAAVIYASSDIDEVVGLADCVLVMHDGQIVAELHGSAIDRAAILAYATGSYATESNRLT